MIAIIRALAFKIVHKVVRNVTVAFVGVKTLIIWISFNAREGSELFVENVCELNVSQKKSIYFREYSSCIVNCAPADVNCYAFCSREFQESTQKCPCGSKCLTGCPCDEFRQGYHFVEK